MAPGRGGGDRKSQRVAPYQKRGRGGIGSRGGRIEGGGRGRGRGGRGDFRSNSLPAKGIRANAAIIVDKPTKEDSSDEDEDLAVLNPGGTSLYDALLSSLQHSGKNFAHAYAWRKREEMGGSSSESDESEEEIAEAGEKANEDEGEDEENEVEVDKHLTAKDGIDSTKSCKEFNGTKGAGNKGDLEGEVEGQMVQCHSNNVDLSEGDGSGPLKEDDDDNDEGVGEGNSDEEIDGGEAGLTSKGEDPFLVHTERVLTNMEVNALSSSKAKFETKGVAWGISEAKWLSDQDSLPKAEKELNNCRVKARLEDQWKELHKGREFGDFDSGQQCQFFGLCNSYSDVLHSQRPPPEHSNTCRGEETSLVDAYLLHVLNHLLKTRDRIAKNEERIKRRFEGEANGLESVEQPPRDQGFTRPKVLLLLPSRSAALRVVERLLAIAPASQQMSVEHKDRFFEDFGVEEEEDEDEVEGKKSGGKPADYQALFGGNNDDHFRLGVKLTRKSIKLYSEFYSSDIIIASPIGLVTQIGEAKTENDKDVDFLSSIEIVVVDLADVILMQNWGHVEVVFAELNRLPKKQHGTDFMRIREWCLNGWARHYRQTIILSGYLDAAINALFHRSCMNHAGKVKLRCQYSGTLSRVIPQVRQVYERIDCESIADAEDARFSYFVKNTYPRIRDSMQGGTLLFVRSYFEFVRLRNFLKSEGASFALLGEYSKTSDISRARSWFFHGQRRVLLYTERAHFYHRFRIRGIRELVFVSLPGNPKFYAEMLNLLEGTESPSSSVLFTQFDNLQLERIVGSARSSKMLKSQNRTFMFC